MYFLHHIPFLFFTNSIILPSFWLRYTNINFCADGTTAALYSLYWMSISTGNPRGAVFSQDFSSLAFHRNFLIFRSVRCHTCVITRCDAHKRSRKLHFFAKVSEIRPASYWKLLHIYLLQQKINIVHLYFNFSPSRFFPLFNPLLNRPSWKQRNHN